MTNVLLLISNIYFLAIFSAVMTFLLSTKIPLYPVIIYVAEKKKLMDVPLERSAHSTQVPNLGGLGLFITFSLTLIVLSLMTDLSSVDLIKINALMASTIILLFLGIKDDLVLISPLKKLIGQLVSAAIVIFLSDVRIVSLEGLLGIGELPYFLSVVFSAFVFILVINAINLIDGIDGLAASMAIVASSVFGFFFIVNGHYMMTLVSFILVGALAGFLKYNLSKSHKIFMGDCGSMLVGFLLAYQGMNFLIYNSLETATHSLTNAPIILLAVLSFPLLDTLRVFAIRIRQKRSPFSADRNHIHHRLLNLGFTHIKATLLLTVCAIFTIGIGLSLGGLNLHLQLLFIVCSGILLYLFPFLKIFDRRKYLNLQSQVPDKVSKTMEGIKISETILQSPENINSGKGYTGDIVVEVFTKSANNGNGEVKEKVTSNPKILSNRSTVVSELTKSQKKENIQF